MKAIVNGWRLDGEAVAAAPGQLHERKTIPSESSRYFISQWDGFQGGICVEVIFYEWLRY
jgi:hypothetical protein